MESSDDKLPLCKQTKPINVRRLYELSLDFFQNVNSFDELYLPENEEKLTKYLYEVSKVFLK